MGKFDEKCTKEKLDGCQKDHAVTCSLCNEILIFSTEDTAPLVEHLRTKHPNIQVARFPPIKKNLGGSGDENSTKRIKVPSKAEAKTETQCVNKGIKKMYETTVELWQRSPSPIKCETCGVCATPIVRSRKHTKTQSKTAALFLLGCWPFCFLPYLMGGSSSDNITDSYCTKCGNLVTNFLPEGNKLIYDEKTSSKFARIN